MPASEDPPQIFGRFPAQAPAPGQQKSDHIGLPVRDRFVERCQRGSVPPMRHIVVIASRAIDVGTVLQQQIGDVNQTELTDAFPGITRVAGSVGGLIEVLSTGIRAWLLVAAVWTLVTSFNAAVGWG